MDKISFWLMVGVASVIFIYLFKMLAAKSGVQGLSDFAQSI